MTTHKLIACQQEWFEKWWEMNGYSYGNLMRVMTDPWKAPFACCEGEYGLGWLAWLLFRQFSQGEYDDSYDDAEERCRDI